MSSMFQVKIFLFLTLINGVLCMFIRTNLLDHYPTSQLNYGVAVSDVNNDGRFDWIVAGYSGNNFVFAYDKTSKRLENIATAGSPYESLMDPRGQAIGVCACDIDGDGREEIYFLNTNNAYAGRASYGDKLFKWRNGRYEDLFSDAINSKIDSNTYAGRSVACVDRFGKGKYSIAVATYSSDGTGRFALIEMDESNVDNNPTEGKIALRNAATEARIDKATGGRGIVVGPIINPLGYSDIFFDNEGNSWRMGNDGSNFLFMNTGGGKFKDIASKVGVTDRDENGRGVALADINRDGRLDIVYGNWDGYHRLYIQNQANSAKDIRFRDMASEEMRQPSLIRTVIVRDFNNDGHTDILYNNICGRNGAQQPNRLFTIMNDPTSTDFNITKVSPGAALEPDGCGTGGSVMDVEGDGVLDLILSHGESNGQPLTTFKAGTTSKNKWLRVLPQTRYGAPARGAKVTLKLMSGQTMTEVIDGGSGYLCQMEPVAHFGLGQDDVVKMLDVVWPDAKRTIQGLTPEDTNKLHVMKWTGEFTSYCNHGDGQQLCNSRTGTEESICDSKTCPFRWYADPWGTCSKPCGGGKQKRKVHCKKHLSQNQLKRVSRRLCEMKARPLKKTNCNTQACPQKWYSSKWSQCSATCGEGTQQRRVQCRTKTTGGRKTQPEDLCQNLLRPENVRRCQIRECPTETRSSDGQWVVSSWSQCSVTCGEGLQSRLIRCLDLTGSVSSECSDRNKPTTSKVCRLQQCPDTQCEDAFSWCHLVPKQNLCNNSYYGRQCCLSCQR